MNEFFAIVTDPRRVRNPRSKNEALQEMEKYFLSKNILKIYSGPGILEGVLDLLKRYEVTKQDIFDLQLVATMLSNSVARLYTFNVDDFAKFKEIDVLAP